MGEDKKISLTETIIMLMVTMVFDLAQMLLDLLDGGILSAWIINPFAFGIIQTWAFLRGVRGVVVLAGNVAEFVPIINFLPLRTGTMLATIYITNNPKLAKVASAATGKIVKSSSGVV